MLNKAGGAGLSGHRLYPDLERCGGAPAGPGQGRAGGGQLQHPADAAGARDRHRRDAHRAVAPDRDQSADAGLRRHRFQRSPAPTTHFVSKTEQRITTQQVDLIHVNHLMSLPKGQCFAPARWRPALQDPPAPGGQGGFRRSARFPAGGGRGHAAHYSTSEDWYRFTPSWVKRRPTRRWSRPDGEHTQAPNNCTLSTGETPGQAASSFTMRLIGKLLGCAGAAAARLDLFDRLRMDRHVVHLGRGGGHALRTHAEHRTGLSERGFPALPVRLHPDGVCTEARRPRSTIGCSRRPIFRDILAWAMTAPRGCRASFARSLAQAVVTGPRLYRGGDQHHPTVRGASGHCRIVHARLSAGRAWPPSSMAWCGVISAAYSGANESSFIYHNVKPWVRPAFIGAWFIYLGLPGGPAPQPDLHPGLPAVWPGDLHHQRDVQEISYSEDSMKHWMIILLVMGLCCRQCRCGPSGAGTLQSGRSGQGDRFPARAGRGDPDRCAGSSGRLRFQYDDLQRDLRTDARGHLGLYRGRSAGRP